MSFIFVKYSRECFKSSIINVNEEKNKDVNKLTYVKIYVNLLNIYINLNTETIKKGVAAGLNLSKEFILIAINSFLTLIRKFYFRTNKNFIKLILVINFIIIFSSNIKSILLLLIYIYQQLYYKTRLKLPNFQIL